MKTRDLSPYSYFQALQREYICLEIRSKIYYYKEDRLYFKNLMDKKKASIENIGVKNRLTTIFQDHGKYLEIWNEIVPEFGLPNFIYNTLTNTKQMQFPYKGTVVRSVIDKDVIGICKYIDFKNNTINIIDHSDGSSYVPLSEVERISPSLTDEYYYFFPGNQFKVKNRELIGMLEYYNLDSKLGTIRSTDDIFTVSQDELSRVL